MSFSEWTSTQMDVSQVASLPSRNAGNDFGVGMLSQ